MSTPYGLCPLHIIHSGIRRALVLSHDSEATEGLCQYQYLSGDAWSRPSNALENQSSRGSCMFYPVDDLLYIG